MKTNLVYVVTSTIRDCYMEMAFVSSWSAKYHNPDCNIILVCDQDTNNTLNQGIRQQYKSLFNEIKVVTIPENIDIIARSRWLKTNLRRLVKGDYLFLDSDTIVCEDLSYIDNFTFDIGAVLEGNTTFDRCIFRHQVTQWMKQIYNIDVTNESIYYNSGVIYAKDNNNVARFYEKWHEEWKYSYEIHGLWKDQQPMMKANLDFNHIITAIMGCINCQIMFSVKYLNTASVLHYQNCYNSYDEDITPFHSKKIYERIKKEGLSSDIQQQIIACKSSFEAPTILLSANNALKWDRIRRHPRLLSWFMCIISLKERICNFL